MMNANITPNTMFSMEAVLKYPWGASCTLFRFINAKLPYFIVNLPALMQF
jgi:hypothetical protein